MAVDPKYLPKYTYHDYKHWKGDWELIGGIPYAMSPPANRKHQLIAGNLYFQLKSGLKKWVDCQAFYELDWIISDDTTVRPD